MADLATMRIGYPVALTAELPQAVSRFWAIPLLGIVAKGIILIICQLVVWIQVMLSGQYPSWAYTLNAGFILWTARISAFFYGLTDEYPPFSMT